MKTESTEPASSEQQGPSKEALECAKDICCMHRGSYGPEATTRGIYAGIVDGYLSPLRLQLEQAEKTAELAGELAEALDRASWSGNGPLDGEEFYCPVCNAHHADCTTIPHLEDCPVGNALTRYAATKGNSP